MVQHPRLQQAGDAAFGPARAHRVDGVGQRRLADRDGGGDLVQFGRILLQSQRHQVGVDVADPVGAEIPAQRLGLEHPHPLPLDADLDRAKQQARGGKGGFEAVGVLPVEGAGVGNVSRPLLPLEFRHDRQHLAVAGHEHQRRPLHQVKVQAAEVQEVHPRHEGGGGDAGIAQDRGQPGAAGVMRHGGPRWSG